MVTMILLCGAVCASSLSQNAPPVIVKSEPAVETPKALKEMVERRLKGLKTGHVESKWRCSNGEREWTKFFTHKLAGGDYLEVERGNEEGRVVVAEQAGNPFSYSPRYTLHDREGREWAYTESDLFLLIHTASVEMVNKVHDFRIWGLTPMIGVPTNYPVREGHFDPRIIVDASYKDVIVEAREEKLADGTLKVWLRFWRGGDADYILDPGKDFCPRRIIVRDGDGKEIWHTTFDVHRIDGYWFPLYMKCTYMGTLYAEVTVLYAAFNRPDHVHELDPAAELGLLTGTNVAWKTRDGWETRFVSGSAIVSSEEYERGLADGTIDNSEFRRRVVEQQTNPPGRFPSAVSRILLEPKEDIKRTLRLWEEYTRDFIMFYQLTSEQAASAWNIWRECFDDAHRYIGSRKSEFASASERLARAGGRAGTRDNEAVDSRPSGSDVELARKRLDDLWAPVEKIFGDRLRPRLKSLLTAEQIAKGERERSRFEQQMKSSLSTDD